MSPEQQALCAAIVANPDDDLPRLVYADWLEENGDPDRAEFIRLQCRLANCSPTDDDYGDVCERERELRVALGKRLTAERPELPTGFRWESERRGFADKVVYNGGAQPLDDIARGLEQIAAVAPLRGLWAANGLPERLPAFARLPVFGRFEYLFVDATSNFPAARFFAALADNPHAGQLRDLQFPFVQIDDPAFAAFARTESLRHLTRLDAGWRQLTPRSNAALASAVWRESLTCLHAFGGDKFPEVTRGVALPRLRSILLYNTDLTPALADCLNRTDLLPALDDVTLFGDWYIVPTQRADMVPLTRPLAALSLRHVNLGPDGIHRLLDSPTGSGLRHLDLDQVHAGDGWPAELARTPLPNLRVLKLTSALLTGDALLALARAPFWESITEVELCPDDAPAKGKEWAAFFGVLRAPRLRRLGIRGAKLQEKGVRALMENTSLPALRSLELYDCGFGERIARALFRAPSLQHLNFLDVAGNRLGASVEELIDPGVLPHARSIDLGTVRLSDEVANKLRNRPEVRFEPK